MARDGQVRWIGHICQPVYGKDGAWLGWRGSNRDITASKLVEIDREQLLAENLRRRVFLEQVEHELREALAASAQHEREVSALLAGARAVLTQGGFADLARAIFAIAKDLTGATAGYIALASADRTENHAGWKPSSRCAGSRAMLP